MLFNTRVRLSARDEPEWVSFVPETYTKPNQTKPVQDCALATSRKVFGLRGGAGQNTTHSCRAWCGEGGWGVSLLYPLNTNQL